MAKDKSEFTEKDFREWVPGFLAAHPENEILPKIANWKGDKLWRWAKRRDLMKSLVG